MMVLANTSGSTNQTFAVSSEVQRLQKALQQQMDVNDALQAQLARQAAVQVPAGACGQCKALKLALQDQILQNQQLKQLVREKSDEIVSLKALKQPSAPVTTANKATQSSAPDQAVPQQSLEAYALQVESLQARINSLQNNAEVMQLREICGRQQALLAELQK